MHHYFERPDGNEAYCVMIARGDNRSGNFRLRGSLRIHALATISYVFLFMETIENSQFKISGRRVTCKLDHFFERLH